LELDYSGYCVIVLLCSWNKARSAGSNATIQRDGYGFTVAKLPGPNSHVSPESFAFSINVQQVFYCNAEENSAWKVVCHVDIRSRRSALQFAADENEADYDGLITDFGNDLEVLGDFLSLSKCTSRIWQCPEHLMCVVRRVQIVTPMRADSGTP
jgi:hypothetical protein